ncbi:hypothetical protein HKT18_10615 [Flavobacterium sp. IMCC34852]|uniref:LicD/FKTN/FKRP nucleotidyltransferase domain-containing protein n=1 Tax=Flavobacterium rivulicola TaxID=2732161 RepID=A0A7Y3RB42_9FLAO|nr:LicD family protein [Flavobacterium sp. IMCC34852]NNT72667.1 hypothetical protein [Flavobacterium sp. IMCC34852]
MGYAIKLTGRNKKNAESLLHEVTLLLEKFKVNYALEGGTLLGIYRENRLLPWDSDVDISILSEELLKMDEVYKELHKSNYRIRIRTFEANDSPFQKGMTRLIKIRKKYFFGLLKGNVCLEIFIKFTDKEHVYWKVADKTMMAPKKFYENYTQIEFLNKHYTIPLLTEEYLTHKYGDWKKPNKNWNASTDELSILKN